ncbi:glycosyltransferase [uncultured Thiodictyon sp.]|uniref:glycosyltransferase n=1 Tax=uncultured Thiodictyon sp. TaxID=1846217 RepID=UPI0025F67CD1|nr:glycosyltransferase [uncultured Thiodictyon sp.]
MIVFFVLCMPALLVSALGFYTALLFLHHLQLPTRHRDGLVTLILPLTGAAQGLEGLLNALAAQTLRPRRLIIGVEGSADPAYRRATDLAGRCDFPIDVVLAAPAHQCAQKCANQIAALRQVDARDEAVVLLDADILPPPWWLCALVTPLLEGTADVVSGYRWPLPAARLGAHLVASIDRAIALLPRLGGFNVVWGGSLAFSAQALATLQPERLLARTLSDDCTLGEQAGARGLRVLTRRALLVPTPTNGTLASLWRFGRRQYQIIRIYRPGLWWLAAAALTARVATWGLLFTHLDLAASRLVLGILLGLSLAGLAVQSVVAQRLGCPDTAGVRLGQGLLALLKPLVDLFHWSIVIAALAARTVRWGHIVYRADGPANISIRSRTPWA